MFADSFLGVDGTSFASLSMFDIVLPSSSLGGVQSVRSERSDRRKIWSFLQDLQTPASTLKRFLHLCIQEVSAENSALGGSMRHWSIQCGRDWSGWGGWVILCRLSKKTNIYQAGCSPPFVVCF